MALLGAWIFRCLGGITEYLLIGLRNVVVLATKRCVLNYGGEISVSECWELLSQTPNAVLIDVRTNAEWAFVGMPNLGADMNPIIPQQWAVFPTMTVDPNFSNELAATLQKMQLGHDAKLCFLCRSGVRSLAAARVMWELGYKETYNITGGFEGDPDNEGHRGQVNGWKAAGLPWRQN